MYIDRLVDGVPTNQIKNSESILQNISNKFPGRLFKERTYFKIAERFCEDIFQNRKTTTIRYTPTCLEYPASKILPLILIKKDGTEFQQVIGSVEVEALCYKAFGELNYHDAQKDGFGSEQELKSELKKIYGEIRDYEIISIFFISPR